MLLTTELVVRVMQWQHWFSLCCLKFKSDCTRLTEEKPNPIVNFDYLCYLYTSGNGSAFGEHYFIHLKVTEKILDFFSSLFYRVLCLK